MSPRFKVLLFQSIHAAGTKILQGKCDLVYAQSFKEEDLVRQAKDANALILVRHGDATRKVIEGAPGLKVIGKHGIGLDKIDMIAARERGVAVVYTPGSNTVSVSEQFVTLALMLSKKIKLGELSIRGGQWKTNPFDFLGIEVSGKTLGVMGFGKIGQQTARICHKGFDMPVLFHDVVDNPEVRKELDAKRVDVKQIFSQSDFVSINLPLIPQTRGLINADLIRLMKPTAYLINMARGPIWKEADVVRALKENWIAGAGADVFEEEPSPSDNPLYQFKNFVGTPHMGAHTEEAMERSSMVARDIIAVLEGRKPQFPAPEEFYRV
jgi:D-3-phosphoglycerate dehydrogenase / 2-oxoglutarate reductase